MKRLLISGASSGIGLVTSEYFYNKGYDIVTIGRSESNLPCPNLEVDFSKQLTKHCLTELFSEQQPFDTFINCAGLLPGKDFKAYCDSEKNQIFNVNFFAPVNICETLLAQQLLNKDAVIILLSSISAYKGSFDEMYSATKGAINSFIKSLALKIAPDYRVVGVAPGMTERTRMTEQLVTGRFEHTLKSIPMAKAAQPEEIATLFEYIIKHGCSMTGNVIDINGGQYLR